MLFRHAKQGRDKEYLRYEGPKLAVSVVVFFVLAAVVPVYNKTVFEGVAGDVGFPYPLTTALLQLGFCAVVLTAVDVVKHWLQPYRTGRGRAGLVSPHSSRSSGSGSRSSGGNNSPDELRRLVDVDELRRFPKSYDVATGPSTVRERDNFQSFDDEEEEEAGGFLELVSDSSAREAPQQSWIFGPHFWFKVRLTCPIGILFGLKYGVTNWGLHLLPLAPHLLLQATDLMWTVLFARIFNREFLTMAEFVTCVASTTGTLLIAYRTNQTVPDGLYSVAVNLVSPILLGLCITTLRNASERLLVREAGEFGRVPGMTSFEMTAIKLWTSTLTIMPFALIFENDALGWLGQATHSSKVTAFEFASQQRPGLGLAALGGGVFVLIFQVNMTWMSKMATAITVGMIGALKIFPQWFVAVLFAKRVDMDILNVLGAVIVLGSSIVWAYLRFDTNLINSKPAYEGKPARRRSESLRKRLAGYGALQQQQQQQQLRQQRGHTNGFSDQMG